MTWAKLLHIYIGMIAGSLVYGTELFSLQHCAPKYQARTSYDGQRYRLSKEHRASHSESMKLCQEDGSVLITIKSRGVTDVIDKMLNNTLWRPKNTNVNSIWIGLIMNGQHTGDWSDGSQFDNRVAAYTNWEISKPKTATISKCISLSYQRQWHWGDAYCKERVFYICEDRVPTNASSLQLNRISKNLTNLASKASITSDNLNTLLASLDNLLYFKQLEMDNSGISRRDILRTIAVATNKYDAIKESYFGNGKNVMIRVTNLFSCFGFFYNTSQDSQGVTSSVTLTKELIQESQQRANSSAVKASSVLYRKSFLFTNSNTFLLNDDKLLRNVFQFSFGSVVVSPVISMDIQDVTMNDLQSLIIVRHQTFLKVNNSELSNRLFSSSNKVREAILKCEKLGKFNRSDFTFKCVSWDFNKNFVGSGGWSESGCHLSSVEIVNGSVVITCHCNHTGNYAAMLKFKKSSMKVAKIIDENLQMLLLGMCIGILLVVVNGILNWWLGTILQLKIYLKFKEYLVKPCFEDENQSLNDQNTYFRLPIAVRTVV